MGKLRLIMGKIILSKTEPCLSRGIRWKTLWDSYGMHHPQLTPWKVPSMTLTTKCKMGWPMQRGHSCMSVSVSPKTTSIWLWITAELYLSMAVRTTPIVVAKRLWETRHHFKGTALPLLKQKQRDSRLILRGGG